MALNTRQIEDYKNQGHLVVHNLLGPEALTGLIQDLNDRISETAGRLNDQGRLGGEVYITEPFNRRLAKLYEAATDEDAKRELWHVGEVKYYDLPTEGLFRVMTHPAILDVVEQFVGPEIRFHPQSNVRAKLPNHLEGLVGWHQDCNGLDADSEQTMMINFWIPLVDVSMDMGGMQVMLGDHHRRPLLPAPGGIIQVDDLPSDKIVDCPMPMGSALMIQKKTIHRSLPNTSHKVRWSLDIRYCDADLPAGRKGGFVVRSRRQPERAVSNFKEFAVLVPELQAAWA